MVNYLVYIRYPTPQKSLRSSIFNDQQVQKQNTRRSIFFMVLQNTFHYHLTMHLSLFTTNPYLYLS
jgi:hypothetical protein